MSPVGQALSPEEVEQFWRLGYVVLRGVLEQELMDHAVRRVWSELPSSFLPDLPNTWRGMVTDSCQTGSIEQRRGHLKFRECLWADERLQNLCLENPLVRAVARQLVGGELPAEQRIRGIYLVLPNKRGASRPLPPHIDRHVFQVGFVGYLQKTAASCGAFTVWPGSHHWVDARLGRQEGLLSVEERNRLVDEFVRSVDVEPVPFAGGAGDVMFYHHRLMHRAGANTTRSVRYALFADFARDDIARSQIIERPGART